MCIRDRDYALRGDGSGADFFEDQYYSGWFTAPSTAGEYTVVLSWRGVPQAVATLKVTEQPELAVLSDLEILGDEFAYTGGLAVKHLYRAFIRMSEYAETHHGVFLDVRQEIERTSPTNSTPYRDYSYENGGLAQRRSMGIAIDNYIHSLETYKNSLRYLAIIGDDAVIPAFRRADPRDEEKKYPPQVGGHGGNPTLMDSALNYILTDVPYASFDATNPDTVAVPTPDLAVARLFEATPLKLKEAIDAYENPLDLRQAAGGAGLHLPSEADGVAWETAFDLAIMPRVLGYYTVTNLTGSTTVIPKPVQPGHFYRYNGRRSNWTNQSVTDALGNTSLTVLYSHACLLYTSPSPRDLSTSRMPSSA